MKHPINILCVKYGNKYSNQHVYRMKRMVEKNLTLPFNFYVLSDTKIPKVNTIPLDLSLDLESYWWKVCLFNTNLEGPTIYLDLDIVIQNNFDDLVDKIENDKILLINVEDGGTTAIGDTTPIPTWSPINSSVMCFNCQQHKEIYDFFVNNIDNHIVEFYGLDRFVYRHFNNRLNYLTFKKDWYFRHFDTRLFLSSEKKDGWPFVPYSKFCIVKQAEKFDDPYIGLEEFFL